jgi:hypothetical protein
MRQDELESYALVLIGTDPVKVLFRRQIHDGITLQERPGIVADESDSVNLGSRQAFSLLDL